MSARDRILARIRRQQGRGGSAPAQAETELSTTYLRRHPRGPLPAVGPDLVARFVAKAQAAASTCERVAGERNAPAAVARYLDAHGLPRNGCVWPRLGSLDWRGAGLALEPRAAKGDDVLGVTGVFCAIAETGVDEISVGALTHSARSLDVSLELR